MKRLTTYVPDFFRNHPLEMVQMVLCPLYFWLSFMVNARLTAPYPAWVVVLVAGWAITAVYALAGLLYVWNAPDHITRVCAMAGFYIVLALVSYLLAYIVLPARGIFLFDRSRLFRLDEYLLNMAQLYVTFFLAAVGLVSLYRTRDYFRKERQLKREIQRYALQFAMAQISPHSVYNAFHDLHAILDKKYPSLAPILLTIIDVMRYNTKHAGRYDGFVPLGEEIDQLRLLQELYLFRYNNRFYLKMDIDVNLAEFQIIPISVSSLLENAARYGDGHHPDEPIVLSVTAREGELRISCRNKIRKASPAGLSTGIGQPNLRHRLQLVYGPEAELEINMEKNVYEAIIQIPLRKAKIILN